MLAILLVGVYAGCSALGWSFVFGCKPIGYCSGAIIVGITIRRYRFQYTINVDTVESREGIIARNTVQSLQRRKSVGCKTEWVRSSLQLW